MARLTLVATRGGRHVAPMLRVRGVACVAIAIVLAGCGGAKPGGPPPADAVNAATRLLAAAAADDRIAFEAEIDRSAVRDDLRRQMVQLGQQNRLEVDGGPSDFALDRMIGPQAVRLVDEGSRAPVRAPPSASAVQHMLKMVGRREACLADPTARDRCLMTFADGKGRWRLVGMQALGLEVPVRAGG